MDNVNIIIRPLVTEKSTRQQETRNAYSFQVHQHANKQQIRDAVEKLYSVKVKDVRTMNRKGKPRRAKDKVPAKVEGIESDPNRSCLIALIKYENGDKAYILAPKGLTVGATVQSGPQAPPEIGNAMPLANVPAGLEIHNIEMNPGQGGKLIRSAGGVGRLGAKEGEWSVVILPSGEMRRVRSECRATIGQLGNLDWINVSIGKAGRSRHMGIRPHTRAKAMNPIDHPLGGGEGRSNGGRHPVSRTGVPAKGGITRNPRKNSEKLILRRRKFGRFQQRPQTVNI